MFFKPGAGISGKVDRLVTKYIKRGAEAICLDRTIGRDPEQIIRLGKSNGSVRRECCFLTGAETYQELSKQEDRILRLTASHKGLERTEELSSST